MLQFKRRLEAHTKVEMTMVYAHLSPQHLRNAVDTVRFSASGNMSRLNSISAVDVFETVNTN